MLFFPDIRGRYLKAIKPFIWVRSVKSDEFLFADGNVLSNRSFSKLVAGESGWNYMAGKLKIYGATPCPAGVDEKRERGFFRRGRRTCC